jgi:hypothetical protein
MEGMMGRLLRIVAAGVVMLPLAVRAQMLPVPDGIPPLVADYMAVKGLMSYDVATLPPKDIVAAAFGTDYGRALVAELGDIIMDSADKSCLQSSKLGPAEVARGAGEIYQRYGVQMMDVIRSTFNAAAYEAALKGRAPTLHADMAQLRGDPDVQKLLALEQPTRFSGIADLIVENLSRYLMLKRIRLSKDVNGLARGDTELRDRYVTEDAEEERYQLVANSKSPQLERYIALLKTLAEVRAAGIDEAAALRLGLIQLFSGVEAEFAKLCIPGIKQP